MTSPRTPIHSRHSSIIDGLSDSPLARQQSRMSSHDPSTPNRNSYNRDDMLDLNTLSNGAAGDGNTLGNLADELADAYSDSGDEEGDEEPLSPGLRLRQQLSAANMDEEKHKRNDSQTLPVVLANDIRSRQGAYDGSEFGSESDLDSSGLPPSLIAKLDVVESLVRRGTESYGGPADDVVRRMTDALRDLGSQSSVEGNTSRLITAHSALTTHLTHQTRQLHSLTFPIVAPMAPTLDGDAVDDLLPLLVSLSEDMPRPSTAAFDSLTALHTMTSDLVQTLNYLGDTLHMSRQTTATATRRLKTAKELIAEVRRDDELREEGERWLTRGNWGDRLQNRECAGVCGEVMGGFEEVCNGWRERLLAQAEPRA